MLGNARRKEIIKILKDANTPVSGTELARHFSVSRQVIVQDIALLRAEKAEVSSTNKGYIIKERSLYEREVKVRHLDKDIKDELNTIVDLGGTVKNVSILHKTYGKITADLNIKSRHDVNIFLAEMKNRKSTPLKNLTENAHYHIIQADSDNILDLIEHSLKEKGYLIK